MDRTLKIGWAIVCVMILLGVTIPAAAPVNAADDAIARIYTAQLAQMQSDYQVRLQALKAQMVAEYDVQLKQAMKAVDVELAVSIKAKRDALKADGLPPDSGDAISARYKTQLQRLGLGLSSAKAAAHKAALASYAAAIVAAMKREDLEQAVEMKRRQDAMKAQAPGDGGPAAVSTPATSPQNVGNAGDAAAKRAAEKWILSKTQKNVQIQKFRGKNILTAVSDVMDGKPGILCWTVFKRPYQVKMGFGKRHAPDANQPSGGTFTDPWDILGALSSPIKYDPDDQDYFQRVQDAINKVEVFWLIGATDMTDNKLMIKDLYWVGEAVCEGAEGRRVKINQYAVNLSLARDLVVADKAKLLSSVATAAAPVNSGTSPVVVVAPVPTTPETVPAAVNAPVAANPEMVPVEGDVPVAANPAPPSPTVFFPKSTAVAVDPVPPTE